MAEEVHHILFDLNVVDEAQAISRAAGGLQASNEAVARALTTMRPAQVVTTQVRTSRLQQALRGAVLGRFGRIRGRFRSATRGAVVTRGPGKTLVPDDSVRYGPLTADESITRAAAASIRRVTATAKVKALMPEVQHARRPAMLGGPKGIEPVKTAEMARQERLRSRLEIGGFQRRESEFFEGVLPPPSRAARHAEMIRYLEALEARSPAPDLQRLWRTDPSRPGMQDPERFRGVIKGTDTPIWGPELEKHLERLVPEIPVPTPPVAEPVELNFLELLRNTGSGQ